MNKNIAVILVILLMALAAGYWGFMRSKNAAEGELTFCTMEALLCPDGSGVGRQGPRCEFAACPNQTSFTGVLRQIEGEFRLEMDLPEQQVGRGYSMPLKFSRISNVLSDFVDKKVVVTGTFSTGSTLEVESINTL
jgi:hypothetical protein